MPAGGPWCGPPLRHPGACCALLTGVRFALLAGACRLNHRCFGELKFSRCWLFFCRIQKWTTIKAKLLSEIAWGFQKANIGPCTAVKCIKMEGNVGFLRRMSQNRQRRLRPICPDVVMKEQYCSLLQHFCAEPHTHWRQKQSMLYFFTKAAMVTIFWL